MKITHDQQYGLTYIRLRKKKKQVLTTIVLTPQINIDISRKGKLYGIEIVGPLNLEDCDRRKGEVKVNKEKLSETYPCFIDEED